MEWIKLFPSLPPPWKKSSLPSEGGGGGQPNPSPPLGTSEPRKHPQGGPRIRGTNLERTHINKAGKSTGFADRGFELFYSPASSSSLLLPSPKRQTSTYPIIRMSAEPEDAHAGPPSAPIASTRASCPLVLRVKRRRDAGQGGEDGAPPPPETIGTASRSSLRVVAAPLIDVRRVQLTSPTPLSSQCSANVGVSPWPSRWLP